MYAVIIIIWGAGGGQAMYTFVFNWVPAMFRVYPASDDGSPVPLGSIFSTFMVCITVGGALYELASSMGCPAEKSGLVIFGVAAAALAVYGNVDIIMTHLWTLFSFLLLFFFLLYTHPTRAVSYAPLLRSHHALRVLPGACNPCNPVLRPIPVLSPAAYPDSLTAVYGGFLLFETCVGASSACTAALRSATMPESLQATMITIFRLPL